MVLGIFSIIAACICWGLVSIIPDILPSFDPVEGVMGRYLVFGLISLAFLLIQKRHLLTRAYTPLWKKAFWLALISNPIHYLGIFQAIRQTETPGISMLLALSPITASFYTTWKRREHSYRKLFFPSILMAIGVFCVQTEAFSFELDCLLGIFCGIAALAAWTWFLVDSDTYARETPSVSIDDLVIAIGVATLGLTASLAFFFKQELFFDKSRHFPLFLLGAFSLGVVSSLLGSYFWKRGSSRVPPSIASQLTIFQTVFLLIFFFAADHRWPSSAEGIGMISIVLGLALAPQFFRDSSLNDYSY